MSEDRITALERRLDSERATQAAHNKEEAENMTMLLGMVAEQQREGREMKQSIERLDMKITSLDTRAARVERGVATLEVRLDTVEKRNATMDAKLDAILTLLNKQTP